jgi:O-antigen/teichoic acid export membrane protein
VNSKIAKNAFWLFSGQAIGRALRVIIVIVAARVLGASDWGAFSYALSLAAAFTIFSDIGINALLVREGSRNSELAPRYLSTGLVIKLILISVISIFAITAKDLIIRIPEAVALVPLIIAVFTLDSLRDYFCALARSIERMDIEARGQIVTNAGIVGFGLLFLIINPSSVSLALGYVIGISIGLCSVLWPLRDRFKGLIKEFSRKLIKEILVSAWPFGLVGLMGVINVNTDILVIGTVGSAADVGLYAAAQKPIQLLYLIPSLLAASFFPTLSREAGEPNKFRSTLEQGLKSAFLFALPLALGGLVAARPIINFLYGAEFISSYPSLALLALTILFVFPSLFFTNALFARNSQKSFYGYLAIGVFANVVLDLLLIPRIGIAGCAIATLAVQMALFVYGIVKLKKSISFRVFPEIWRIVVSSFIMAGVTATLLYLQVHVVIAIISAIVIYLAFLLILREPTLKQIISAIRRKPGITTGVEV